MNLRQKKKLFRKVTGQNPPGWMHYSSRMNYDKSNIPLMRMGDIRKTLKRTFKVRPGRKIKLKARVRDDGNSTRIIYHTATVIKLYPYVVQLQLENGQYTSPGYTKLYLMFHGADEK